MPRPAGGPTQHHQMLLVLLGCTTLMLQGTQGCAAATRSHSARAESFIWMLGWSNLAFPFPSEDPQLFENLQEVIIWLHLCVYSFIYYFYDIAPFAFFSNVWLYEYIINIWKPDECRVLDFSYLIRIIPPFKPYIYAFLLPSFIFKHFLLLVQIWLTDYCDFVWLLVSWKFSILFSSCQRDCVFMTSVLSSN